MSEDFTRPVQAVLPPILPSADSVSNNQKKCLDKLLPEGTGYRAKTRFAKFFNLPELMSMFKEVADIQTVDAHPTVKDGFCGMEVKGVCFTEKELAGEAILAAYKEYKGEAPQPIGSYRGFTMELSSDSFSKEIQLTLKGDMSRPRMNLNRLKDREHGEMNLMAQGKPAPSLHSVHSRKYCVSTRKFRTAD